MNALMLMISVFTIVELNCENLFDCQHDSLKNDVEYTPDGNRRWTKARYWNKVNTIAKTLVSCGDDGRLPDLMALCEVENDSVMRDLTKRSPLKGGCYEYFMTNSNDPRGIDVALVYCRLTFKPLETKSLRPQGDFNDHQPRDVLYVKGIKQGGDTLHVMVVHAPSRIGGKEASTPRRMAVAKTITSTIDSISRYDAKAKIIVTGDFNANADEMPLKELEKHGMTNISSGHKGENGAEGSYKYQGAWDYIDHVLVSQSLYDRRPACRLHDRKWLLEEDKRYGGIKPRRTFYGWRYDKHGCSDHLPLVVTLRGKTDKGIK